MITAYDKAIASFLASALGLLAAFNVNLPWLNPTVVAAITPFVAMMATFWVPNKGYVEIAQALQVPDEPYTSGPQVTPTAPRATANLKLLVPIALAFVLASPSLAADPGRRGKVAAPAPASEPWSPPPLQELAPPQGQWYLGVFGSYDWNATFGNDDAWSLGVAGGYMGKWGQLGAGFEIDAQRAIEDRARNEDELDLWRFSARLRAGFFPSQNLLLYGTGGYAWQGSVDDGFVYGGGVELASTPATSIRLEYLRYEFEQPANAIRAGLFYRF